MNWFVDFRRQGFGVYTPFGCLENWEKEKKKC